jgi:hypothetical protein
MRGAQNFYYFGVLEYVVMIEISSAPQEISVDFECPWDATTQMKSFYDAIKQRVVIEHMSPGGSFLHVPQKTP